MNWKAYIQFVPSADSRSGLTHAWDVLSKDGQIRLGYISWYSPWRRYVVSTFDGNIFDVSCLRTIANFIETEMEKRKHASTIHSS